MSLTERHSEKPQTAVGTAVISRRDETIIYFRWSPPGPRSSNDCSIAGPGVVRMRNEKFVEARKKSEAKQNELARAHYLAAAILLAAAVAFLVLVFVLNRAFDFNRFAY